MNFADMRSEKAIDSIKVAAAVVLMTFINIFLPILSLVILFIWPIPIVYLVVKHGMRHTNITIVVIALINGLLFNPIMGLISIVGFGLVGVIIGGALNEELSPLKTLLAGIAAVLVSHALILYITNSIMGLDFNFIIQEIVNFINQNQELSEFQNIVKNQLQLIKLVFPGLVVISAIITGTLNYYLSLWYLNRKKFSFDIFLELRYWHFPRWLITLGIALTLIVNQNPVFMNLNIILMFFAFLQGFAVGLYYISQKGSQLLRVLYVLLIMFIPLMPVLLLFLGLVDMWFNLRNLNTQKG